jgi:hypothetical protein
MREWSWPNALRRDAHPRARILDVLGPQLATELDAAAGLFHVGVHPAHNADLITAAPVDREAIALRDDLIDNLAR